MLKIKDNVDLKELEKFGYTKHNKETAMVDYYKITDFLAIQIFKDKTIHIQKPIGLEFMVVDVKNIISDLIDAYLVEEVSNE